MGTKLYAVWDTEKGGWWNHKTHTNSEDAKREWWFGFGKNDYWAAVRYYQACVTCQAPKPAIPNPMHFGFDAKTRFVIREVTLQPVEDLA